MYTCAGIGFDPASPPDATALAAEKKKMKTTLRLKASTYVAPRTLRNREAVMNDGYVASGKIVNTNDVDRAKISELEAKLARAEQAAKTSTVRAEAKHREALKLAQDAASLKSEKENLKARLKQQATVPASQPLRAKAPVVAPVRAQPARSAPASTKRAGSASSASANDISRMERVVLEVIAEKTGYDVEMVEHDASLEDDLGIDSIKRIELLAAIQDILGVEGDREALARTQTVGDVIECLRAQAGSAAPVAPVRSAPVQAQSAGPSIEKMERVVLEVIAEKTGYDVEMVEHDASLEDDLGIDSIKRIELLAAIQDILGVEGDREALARTQTVGDVIECLRAQAGSAAPVTPVRSAPVQAQNAGPSIEKMERVVLEVIAEKTGYDVEMVEHDASLEDDLGIDSIKRIELLAAIQDILGVEGDREALARTQTVGDVIECLRAQAGSAAPVAPVRSAPVQVQSAGPSIEKMERVVLEVIAEKTGYDVEMVEHDASLEDDLGIDSIKRIELLAAIQDILGVEGDREALARTQTVGDVIECLRAQAGSAAPVAPVRSAPVQAQSAGPSIEKMERVVLEVIAEKTGYDVEMVEHDASLEDDLGIDSIKRIELLAAIQDILGVEGDREALARTQTVGDVIECLRAQAGSAAPVAPVRSAPVQAQSAGPSIEKMERVVLEVIAEKTGYDVEMVEHDASLEDDLGIDSIKRIELLAAIQDILGVEGDREALARTQTVGDVIECLRAQAGSAVDAGLPDTAVVPASILPTSTSHHVAVGGTVSLAPTSDTLRQNINDALQAAPNVDLTVPELQRISLPPRFTCASSSSTCDRPIVVVDDGTPLARAVATCLAKLKHRVIIASVASHTNASSETIDPNVSLDVLADVSEKAVTDFVSRHPNVKGFIGLENEGLFTAQGYTSALGLHVMFAKHLSKHLRNLSGSNLRNFFVCVTRLDGRLGVRSQYDDESSAGSALNWSAAQTAAFVQRGAVLGLCKSLDLEWTDVFCRGIDVHPALDAASAANCIVNELFCPCVAIREVGYVDTNSRFTTRAVSLQEAEARGTDVQALRQTQNQFTRDDVVLVTGGGRGITPLCISELALRIGGGTFLLLGRSAYEPDDPALAWAEGVPTNARELQKAALKILKADFAAGNGPKPTPKVLSRMVGRVQAQREITGSLDAITAAGGHPIYVRCDCGDLESVEKATRVIQKRHGLAVTSVFHAAGVLRDRMVEKKTLADYELVFNTKVTGLLHVLQACESRNWHIRNLVVFSSLAGFHGNAGQTDYSMANEAIAKATHALARRDSQLSTHAFCFGPWDGGMVNDQLKAHFLSQGVQIIPRDGGAKQVAALLDPSNSSGSPLHHRQYLVGNWGFPAVVPSAAVYANGDVSISFTFVQDENPFLQSHVIQGRPVVPMTCAMGRIAATATELFHGWHCVDVRDFRLYQGISFAEHQIAVEARLKLKIKLPESLQDDLVADAMLSVLDEQSSKWRPAYAAKVVLSATALPPSFAPIHDSVRAYTAAGNNDRLFLTSPQVLSDLYDGTTLFHGPDFQGIHGVLHCDSSSVVCVCRDVPLTPRDCGQFRSLAGLLNPFAADMALQSMLVWARVQHNQAALPTAGSSFQFFSEVPAASEGPFFVVLEVQQGQRAAQVVGTCTAYRADGSVIFKGTDLVVTLSPSMMFSEPGSPRPARGLHLDRSKSTSASAAPKHGAQSAASTNAAPVANSVYDDSGGVVDGIDRRIAVVGMAVEYGGAKDKEQLWSAVEAKNIASKSIATSRLRVHDRTCHLSAKPSQYSDTFVNDTYSCVDSDSEHDLLLRLAMRALSDAGLEKRVSGEASSEATDPSALRNRMGIVSGCLSFPRDRTQDELMTVYRQHFERLMAQDATGGSGAAAAAAVDFRRLYDSGASTTMANDSYNPKHSNMRSTEEHILDPASYVAQELGLSSTGTSAPRYCLDAACASALYCLRLAQDHLLSGDADVMLCGASCLPEPFFILTGFSTFQALPVQSQGQRSRPFQEGSVGLCPGEGGAIMVLKRYADAVRDGDRIHGTLLGVGLSNSGTGMPLKPVVASEEACIRDTYTEFGVDPNTVQYLECHATGTPQGDAAEIEAVHRVFATHPQGGPLVGSSKANFGHSLVAAGFAGMCKLLLSMQKATIPPTPIDVGAQPIDKLVVTEQRPWPSTTKGSKTYPRRGGLSAFGFGGTNAHAIFEEHVPGLQLKVDDGALAAPHSALTKDTPACKLAVVGMAAHFGNAASLHEFEQLVYNGGHAASQLPEKRWRFLSKDLAFLGQVSGVGDDVSVPEIHGCFVDSVPVNHRYLGLSRLPKDQLLPQQLVALRVIDAALKDCGLGVPAVQRGCGSRVAVLVGLGTDMELYVAWLC